MSQLTTRSQALLAYEQLPSALKSQQDVQYAYMMLKQPIADDSVAWQRLDAFKKALLAAKAKQRLTSLQQEAKALVAECLALSYLHLSDSIVRSAQQLSQEYHRLNAASLVAKIQQFKAQLQTAKRQAQNQLFDAAFDQLQRYGHANRLVRENAPVQQAYLALQRAVLAKDYPAIAQALPVLQNILTITQDSPLQRPIKNSAKALAKRTSGTKAVARGTLGLTPGLPMPDSPLYFMQKDSDL